LFSGHCSKKIIIIIIIFFFCDLFLAQGIQCWKAKNTVMALKLLKQQKKKEKGKNNKQVDRL